MGEPCPILNFTELGTEPLSTNSQELYSIMTEENSDNHHNTTEPTATTTEQILYKNTDLNALRNIYNVCNIISKSAEQMPYNHNYKQTLDSKSTINPVTTSRGLYELMSRKLNDKAEERVRKGHNLGQYQINVFNDKLCSHLTSIVKNANLTKENIYPFSEVMQELKESISETDSVYQRQCERDWLPEVYSLQSGIPFNSDRIVRYDQILWNGCTATLNSVGNSRGLLLYEGSVNNNKTEFFFDTGAQGLPKCEGNTRAPVWASSYYINKLGYTPEQLPDTEKLAVKVASGQVVNCNQIVRNCKLKIGDYTEKVDMYVLPVTCCDVILGLEWARKRKPEIDWDTDTLILTKLYGDTSKKYNLTPGTSHHTLLNLLTKHRPAETTDITDMPNFRNEKVKPLSTPNGHIPKNARQQHTGVNAVKHHNGCDIYGDPDQFQKVEKSAFVCYWNVLGENMGSHRLHLPGLDSEDVENFDPQSDTDFIFGDSKTPKHKSNTMHPETGDSVVSIKKSMRREPLNEFDRETYKRFKDTLFPHVLPDKGIPVPPLINIKPGMEHVYPCKQPYKLSKLHLDELKTQIDFYIDRGWIQPSSSPYGSPVLFVPKKGGKLRLCVDYRQLNDITLKDKYPLPDISSIIEEMQGAKYFSSLDLAQGYHQVRLADSDVPKTAFRCQFGSYEWKVMNFGLSNAVPVFVRLLNQVLQPVLGICAMCFIDDIIIYSKTLEQHRKDVDTVCNLLTAAGLYANYSKCEFLKNEVEYCGFLITPEGVKPMHDKVKAITQWEPPTTLYHVRSFLGAVGFYRRFIHNFAKIASPLTDLTKQVNGRHKTHATKETVSQWGRTVKTVSLLPGEWTDECEIAFRKLIEAMTTAPVLVLPDNSKPFELFTDSSKKAVGACLMQRDEKGKLHPCSYFSIKLSDTEGKYPVHEFELVAIFKALKHYRHLLIHNTTTIHTDHAPLVHLKKQPTLSDRQARWLTFLADFDVTIVAVKGTSNVIADALSRYHYDTDTLTDSVKTLKQTFLRHSFNKFSPETSEDLKNYAELCCVYEVQGFDKLSAVTPESARNMYLSPVNSNIGANLLLSEGRLNFLGGQATVFQFDIQSEFFPTQKEEESGDAMEIDFVPPAPAAEQDRIGEIQIKESIQKGYENDPLSQSVINGDDIKFDMRYLDGYILYYDQSDTVRLYIPPTSIIQIPNSLQTTEHPLQGEIIRKECTLRELLITDIHSYGHPGVHKTLELLHRRYYWPNMHKDITNFVKGCKECQQNKQRTHKPYGKSRPSQIPHRRWAYVSMDFITQLPMTKNGYDSIMVVVDSFSKRSHFIPCKTTLTGAQCAQLFYKEIYKHHGLPIKIISDRDTKFTSTFWQTLFPLLGTSLAMSTAYRPQSDGQTERLNLTLEEMLRAFTENMHRNWDQFLTAAEFVYNNTIHTSTQQTPFYLDTGQHPLEPHDLQIQEMKFNHKSKYNERIFNYDKVATQYIEEWQNALTFAKFKLQDAQNIMSKYSDIKVTAATFKVGDKVWLDTSFISLPNAAGKMTNRTKFDKRRFGPYVITERLANGRAFKLKLPKGQLFHPVQPISRLEHVKVSERFPQAHSAVPPLPICTEGADTEYEVKRITRSKTLRNRKVYQLEFLGYTEPHPTWYPKSELQHCLDLVDDFESGRISNIMQLAVRF